MASNRPRCETPSTYVRARPLFPVEGSSLGVAATGGDGRRRATRRRQRSPTPQEVPPAKEEGEEEEEEEVAAPEHEGGEASGVYQRGPAKLPPVPLPHNRPVIRPMAKKAWKVLSGTPLRSPASILGVLCRKWYPGIVELSPGGDREPAYTWDRYALASDDQYRNKQERVLAEFWRFLKPEEGLEAQADRTVHTACRKYVTDMHHESRVQAHIDFYASARRMTISKAEARQMTLTRDQYLKVIPWWCRSHADCWSMIVDKWFTPSYIERHAAQRQRRLLRQGPTHHQGSRSLPAFKQAKTHNQGSRSLPAFKQAKTHHQGTSSSQTIRPQPTPALQRVDQLEVRIQEQDRLHAKQTAQLSAQLQAERAAREAQEKRMAEMMLIMQALGQKTGVLVQLPAPSPTTTPLSSADSNIPPHASPGD